MGAPLTVTSLLGQKGLLILHWPHITVSKETNARSSFHPCSFLIKSSSHSFEPASCIPLTIASLLKESSVFQISRWNRPIACQTTPASLFVSGRSFYRGHGRYQSSRIWARLALFGQFCFQSRPARETTYTTELGTHTAFKNAIAAKLHVKQHSITPLANVESLYDKGGFSKPDL